MRSKLFRKLALVLALSATFAIVAAVSSEPASAFEYFEPCPPKACSGGTLTTAGVCDDPQTAFVRRDFWGNLCYQPL